MSILRNGADLSRWWPSVYLDVRMLDPGDAQGLGRRIDLFTKGWLPYTLRWTFTVTEPITLDGFAISARGDLNGTGRWTLTQDGPETVVRYDWTVSVGKPLLRRLSWLFKPVFAANHRWAMARGQESLALELRRRRAVDDAARAAVPDPPGPTFQWGKGRRPA
ncbi:polyketide cyclase [Sinomonas sp. JGH33]|uniref:Polyketide cyclase n=1 Tax=Sinomonas terricola TaxID=3110330 RepID=A0ABU5T5W9_9MICC|nr:SRPBCC family protein [Sinomonas sp. JGH33]MEA5455062.1 polyketide cyclase [Sinomonas sp. JGH33]